MGQQGLDPNKLALVMHLLGQDDGSDFPTATGNPQPWEPPSPRIGGAVPGDIELPPSTSVRGAVPGDINLPKPPTPLDSNRLPDVNTRRMGQNADPAGMLPSRVVNPLDTNRLPESGNMPNGGRGYQAPPPAPQPSPVDALHEFFGGHSRVDPVTELAGLRHDRERTLEHGGNGEGNVAAQLSTLHSQMHDDPFTGDKETARIGGVQHALDVANTENLGPVREQRLQDEQFTMDKLLKPIEAQGRNALAVEQQKADAARDVATTRGDAIQSVAETKAGQGKPLSNDERNVMDKLHQVEMVGPQALQMMEQAHPGIAQAPDKFGSWTDMFPAKVGGMLYKSGAPQSDNVNQVIGYLGEVIPRMVVNSVRSKQLLDDLKLHTPQVGFSDGENYKRLKYVMNTILPATKMAIQQTNGSPTTYDANDPATWQREQ